MKVYFIGGQYMGCWTVRCLLPMMANGWKGNYWGMKKEIKHPNVVMREVVDADIVVFHRANTIEHHKLAIMLKQMGKKIVFDNDDTYLIDETHAFYGLDEKGFKENTKLINTLINNFIKNCDLVTASTPTLAKEYSKLNPNVVVLPNTVEPELFDKPLRNNGNKVRIGVVGSTAYYHDFDIIKEELTELSKDSRVQLVMFGLQSDKARKTNKRTEKIHKKEYGFWDNLNVERVPWCAMEDYYRTLNELKLDILLIPRKESYFNKCKSNVKFLEASMFEIPVVTNEFKDSPYEKDMDYIVSAGNWLDTINSLIEDKELRHFIGKKAHKYVVNNYNINKLKGLWVKAYESIK